LLLQYHHHYRHHLLYITAAALPREAVIEQLIVYAEEMPAEIKLIALCVNEIQQMSERVAFDESFVCRIDALLDCLLDGSLGGVY